MVLIINMCEILSVAKCCVEHSVSEGFTCILAESKMSFFFYIFFDLLHAQLLGNVYFCLAILHFLTFCPGAYRDMST